MTTKEEKKSFARDRAIERASHKCPVIKAANRALDAESLIDHEHALDVLLIELRLMPEAEATIALLERLKEAGK